MFSFITIFTRCMWFPHIAIDFLLFIICNWVDTRWQGPLSRKIPNIPRNIAGIFAVSWQCWDNLGALQTTFSGFLSLSLTGKTFRPCGVFGM